MSPLFRRILGAAFDTLPPAIRSVHDGRAEHVLAGRCRVERGRSLLSRCMAAAARLPPAGDDMPLRVVIRADRGAETWTRHFGSRRMHSSLAERDGLLEERLGLVLFHFALDASDARIVWRVARVSALGLVPLPCAWFRAVVATESASGSSYRFDVRAELPLAGLLVHYRGELEVREMTP